MRVVHAEEQAVPKRAILTWPNPILKQRCADVEAFDEMLVRLLDDMAETMVVEEGIGLAANQVGVLRRIFVMAIPDADGAQDTVVEVINPVIDKRQGEVQYEEGCLSFPELNELVTRAAQVELTYRDRKGEPQQLTATGITAVCIQHELDHLDGITFVDRLSPLKRRLALKAYMRNQRQRAEDERLDQRRPLRN